MSDCELLRMLDGGRRSLLSIRFERGVDEPVARAHLAFHVPADEGNWFTTIQLEGVDRPPLTEEQLRQEGPTIPDLWCFRVPPDGLLAALEGFAGPDYLACAMDRYTRRVLRRMGVGHIAVDEAIAALDERARTGFEHTMAMYKHPMDDIMRDAPIHTALVLALGLVRYCAFRMFPR